MVIFLVWLWLRHRDDYPRWRNVVALFTGMALLIEMIPVAPPRLIGNTGLVDTAMVYGQSVYAFAGDIRGPVRRTALHPRRLGVAHRRSRWCAAVAGSRARSA